MAALALGSAIRILPPGTQCRVLHRLSRTAGAIWHMTNGASVRRVRRHLQLLFAEQAGRRLESLVQDQLALASLNTLIISLLPSLEDEHVTQLLQIGGLRYLDELQSRDEAILLLGGHYGTYGYAIAAALSAQRYPTCLVGYSSSHAPPPQTSRVYNKLYWPRVRKLSQRIRIATVKPGVELQPELSEILERRSDVFYLLADQYFVVRPGQEPPSHLVPLQLLQHTVYLDVTGVRLAKQVGARVLQAIPVRDGYRQRILIEPMEWTSSGTATTDIARDLQVYLAHLERRLLEYPALWRDLRRPDLLPRLGLFESEGPAHE